MDRISTVSFEDGPGDASVGGWDKLEELAGELQRVVASRAVRRVSRSGRDVVTPSGLPASRVQRQFRVSKLFEWAGGVPEEIIEALRAGRVTARVSAVMGAGKSTSLGPQIAEALDARVLQVAHDTVPMYQARDYMRTMGRAFVKNYWASHRKMRLCQMTYEDYWACMRSDGRSTFLSSFDVVLFDEAFMSMAEVYAAKAAFAVFGNPNCSLLLCSATIRVDAATGHGASAGLGRVDVAESTLSVEEVIASGRLVGARLVDRTLVLVPKDSDVQLLYDHYMTNGVDARILDSASNERDVENCNLWLQGDSTTPRVVVAHISFGISVNLYLGYVILWPYRSYWAEVDGVWKEVIEPLSEQMVLQAVSRAGRGMVSGSGAFVMSPDRSEHVELFESDKMRAFAMLFSAGIVPVRGDFWAKCYELFPDGLTPLAATNLLKLPIPVEVAVRFFTPDGLCHPEFSAGLNYFANPDCYVRTSVSEEEIDKSSWVEESASGYYSLDDGGSGHNVVKVPVRATGELKVILHTIVAMVSGNLTLARWRPTDRRLEHDSGSDSERETIAIARRPRRISDESLPTPVPEAPRQPWAFSVRPVEGANRRHGIPDLRERVAEALSGLNKIVDSYRVSDVLPVPLDSGPDSPVDVGFGVVESPGGSAVCELPAGICVKMNTGQSLKPAEALTVVVAAKPATERFVCSRLFDNFAGPWESYLLSLVDSDVVRYLVRKGEATAAYEVVNELRKRFDYEITMVLTRSNRWRGSVERILGLKPSTASLIRAIDAGRLDHIAQSPRFFDRVRSIQFWIAQAFSVGETANVYLPVQISGAQRMRYLGGTSGVVGTRMQAPSSRYVTAVVQRPYVSGEGLNDRLRNRFNRHRRVQSEGGSYGGF